MKSIGLGWAIGGILFDSNRQLRWPACLLGVVIDPSVPFLEPVELFLCVFFFI